LLNRPRVGTGRTDDSATADPVPGRMEWRFLTHHDAARTSPEPRLCVSSLRQCCLPPGRQSLVLMVVPTRPGYNFFTEEVIGKRLDLLQKLLPKAVRVVVLVNPDNRATAETTLRQVEEAARILGLQIQVLNASTSHEIDAAFATLARERPDALFVALDALFLSRHVQIISLAARDGIPAAYGTREDVAAGGLMSYGTDGAETGRQLGVYSGKILKCAKPADLPVVQTTGFVFAINLQTAKTLGIEVPPQLLAITDEVIE
jgi:putative tryptophan/tyrosine transport system substrate-binding protein